MNVTKRNLIILAATLLLILFIQLLRLNIGLNLNALSHENEYTYYPEKAQTLTASEKGTCRKLKGLIIGSSDNPAALLNISTVLHDMQFEFDQAQPEQTMVDISGYDLIIVMSWDKMHTSVLSRVNEYISQGGRILYLFDGSRGQDIAPEVASHFGLKAIRDSQIITNLDFKTELLSGIKGHLALTGENNSLAGNIVSYAVDLESDCDVHLMGNQNIPVIWEYPANGHAMVINTGAIADKSFRGLLTGAISVLMETVLYPVVGSASWQITGMPVDDPVEAEVLTKNYSRNFSRYILDIWWSDVSVLMTRYGLKPTVSYVGSLTDQPDRPFSAPRLADSNMDSLFRTLVRTRGELSFQGYNCLPLKLAAWQSGTDRSGWSDPSDMADALKCSMDFLAKVLPKYAIESYIPPDLCLDSQALSSLKEALPNLKTICGAYDGSLVSPGVESSDLFLQDFAVDPNYGIALPIVSQGAFLDDSVRLAIASAITTHGVLNHRIEADEILNQLKCRGLLWEDLSQEYASLISQVGATYGWLSPDTVGTASEKLRQAENIDVYFAIESNTVKITVDRLGGEAAVMMVSEKPVKALQGCTISKIDSIRYIVRIREKTALLEVGTE